MKLLRKMLRKVLLIEDKNFDDIRTSRRLAQEQLSDEIEQTKTIIITERTRPNPNLKAAK